MRIAFLGHGNVGGALAAHLQRVGHHVTLATRGARSAGLEALLARHPALRAAPAAEAVAAAEVVVLATPYPAAAEVLPPLREALAGKILVDCTNPVGPGLTHGLGSARSGTEAIQALLPATRVVKAFSIYGHENFGEAAGEGRAMKPVMLFCGDDAAAKGVVARLLTELGWEPLDAGGAAQALHLEHMTLLWVRMVRVGGRPARTVWAVLDR